MHFTLECQVKIQFETSTLRTIWKFIKAINSALYHTDVPGNDMYIGMVLFFSFTSQLQNVQRLKYLTFNWTNTPLD